MRKHRFINTETFEGTSIMVLHGSKNYEKAPLETIQKNGEVIQKLNRLQFIPFEPSEKLKGEKHSDYILRDLSDHEIKVERIIKEKYSQFDTYILNKTIKSSTKEYLN